MASYPKSAYGNNNPNSGKPANGDWNAWGGYCYPGGVPSSLMGSTSYTNKTNGQKMFVQMRKELVPLWNLAFQIIDTKHNYPVWANKNGENWGPWGYSNRAISGTNNPSGHSAALSVDMNAPNNGYSSTWQCDMPPAMVSDLESLGLYWGGRYTGKYDPMHYGYCWRPSDVAGHISRAQSILGNAPPTTGDWLDMVSKEELTQIVNDTVAGVLRAPEFQLTDWGQKTKKSFYRVYRHTATQWDYAAGPGRFKFINSDDDYHFLKSCGWINIDHGSAQQVETNLLEYIRNEASKGAQPGAIDDIVFPNP